MFNGNLRRWTKALLAIMVVGGGLTFTGKLIWDGKVEQALAVFSGFGILTKVIIDAYFADREDLNNNDVPDSLETTNGGTGTPTT